MEDVLEVYRRPYDPLRPVVCMDETSKQLLRDTRQSLPMEPGKVEREDYEYERGGVANVFMFMHEPGRSTAMRKASRSTGALTRRMPASSSSDSILRLRSNSVLGSL